MSTQVDSKTGDILPATIILLGGLPVPGNIKTMGERIGQFRKDKGMTQKELAEALKVSQPVVSDYENDVIRLPADVVAELAKILTVSADEILGLKINGSKNSTLKNRRLVRRVQQIDKLPKRDQEALLRTIDAFLTKAS